MSEQVVDIDRLIDEAERIGVVGSPSSTSELALDVLASAVDKKLVGNSVSSGSGKTARTTTPWGRSPR